MGSNAKTDVAAAAYATPRVGTRLLLATNFKLFLSSTSQTPRPTNLSSWPWFRRSLQEGVERGARPRHEVDGVPDQEGRPCRLPGHRQADHDGLGQPSGSHGGRARA